jgi:hypothetical protein
MAGRRPEVDHVRDDLVREIASARALVAAIRALPGHVHPNAPQGIHPKHVLLVVELAFMGIVASWEEFLERALVRYVAGAKTKSGYAPTAKYGLANDITHAYALLSGNAKYDPAKHYLKVTEPKWVLNNADYFFQKHCFSALTTHTALIEHATAIRNRIAHSSEKCRNDFKASALAFLQPGNGKLVKGYMVGNLLLAPAVQLFPASLLQTQPTHFDAYATLFEDMAAAIVPK